MQNFIDFLSEKKYEIWDYKIPFTIIDDKEYFWPKLSRRWIVVGWDGYKDNPTGTVRVDLTLSDLELPLEVHIDVDKISKGIGQGTITCEIFGKVYNKTFGNKNDLELSSLDGALEKVFAWFKDLKYRQLGKLPENIGDFYLVDRNIHPIEYVKSINDDLFGIIQIYDIISLVSGEKVNIHLKISEKGKKNFIFSKKIETELAGLKTIFYECDKEIENFLGLNK